jgi:dynein heavy chain
MLDRANDLITFRIDAVLDEIATMSLCDLPEDEPMPPQEFLQNTQVNIKQKKYFDPIDFLFE